jgi:hypothetical protein
LVRYLLGQEETVEDVRMNAFFSAIAAVGSTQLRRPVWILNRT